MQVHVGVVVGLARVAVDADDNTFLPLHLALVAEGGLLELALHKALFDGAHAPAQLVYAPDVLPRFLLDGVGERLDVVGASQGVGCAGQASFVRQDLLGAERDAGAPLGREREGFVEGVGVQASGAASRSYAGPLPRLRSEGRRLGGLEEGEGGGCGWRGGRRGKRGV